MSPKERPAGGVDRRGQAARQLVAQHSQTFAAMLTPGYAPTEQYVATGRNQGPWTDIYALAASVYEMMTGRPPPESPERALAISCRITVRALMRRPRRTLRAAAHSFARSGTTHWQAAA